MCLYIDMSHQGKRWTQSSEANPSHQSACSTRCNTHTYGLTKEGIIATVDIFIIPLFQLALLEGVTLIDCCAASKCQESFYIFFIEVV